MTRILLFLLVNSQFFRNSQSSSIVDVATRERPIFEEFHAIHDKITKKAESEYRFGSRKCPKIEENRGILPKTVNSLRPDHIDLIASIGDSLTAGRATLAESFFDLDTEYRGSSFATGNDDDLEGQASLYNILSSFLPNSKSLIGGSTGSNEARTAYSPHWGLNFAISGAIAEDVYEQAQKMVSKIRSSYPNEYKNSWKFVNVFIGSNDLCKICTNQTKYGLTSFKRNMLKTITFLRDNLPKVYLNLVPPIHVQFMTETHKKHQFCVDFHRVSCPCITQLAPREFTEIKKSFDESLKRFYQPDFQTDTFAVSIASATALDILPRAKKVDEFNLAVIALDCFHFSRLMQDAVAKAVWKNVLEPINNRSVFPATNYEALEIQCPLEECPYLRTLQNSINCEESQRLVAEPRKMVVDLGVSNNQQQFPLIGASLLGVGFMVISLLSIVILISRRRKIKVEINETSPLLRSTIFSDEENPF